VPFTIAILTCIVAYVWSIAPFVPRSFVVAPSIAVVILTAWHNLRHREWGFAWHGFVRGMGRMLAITIVGVLLILAAGAALRTLHDRRDFLGSLAPLVIWGASQQWVLQTVVLREAQRASSRRKGIVLAAMLFAAVHLPNPLLVSVTGAAGVIWCWLYDRQPNIIPLALSHGLGTLALLYAFDDTITGRLRIGAAYLQR
jgi:membrane protease YdiL (CAAX protease family)